MDLNYLLHREQVEMFRADAATHLQVRTAHREMATAYRAQIDEYRATRLDDSPALPLLR